MNCFFSSYGSFSSIKVSPCFFLTTKLPIDLNYDIAWLLWILQKICLYFVFCYRFWIHPSFLFRFRLFFYFLQYLVPLVFLISFYQLNITIFKNCKNDLNFLYSCNLCIVWTSFFVAFIVLWFLYGLAYYFSYYYSLQNWSILQHFPW